MNSDYITVFVDIKEVAMKLFASWHLLVHHGNRFSGLCMSLYKWLKIHVAHIRAARPYYVVSIIFVEESVALEQISHEESAA